jgi:hypothetical protein
LIVEAVEKVENWPNENFEALKEGREEGSQEGSSLEMAVYNEKRGQEGSSLEMAVYNESFL